MRWKGSTMANESPTPGTGYLHRLLSSGIEPFLYRGAIRSLLGLPDCIGPVMNFAAPLPLGVFHYFTPRFRAELDLPDTMYRPGSAPAFAAGPEQRAFSEIGSPSRGQRISEPDPGRAAFPSAPDVPGATQTPEMNWPTVRRPPQATSSQTLPTPRVGIAEPSRRPEVPQPGPGSLGVPQSGTGSSGAPQERGESVIDPAPRKSELQRADGALPVRRDAPPQNLTNTAASVPHVISSIVIPGRRSASESQSAGAGRVSANADAPAVRTPGVSVAQASPSPAALIERSALKPPSPTWSASIRTASKSPHTPGTRSEPTQIGNEEATSSWERPPLRAAVASKRRASPFRDHTQRPYSTPPLPPDGEMSPPTLSATPTQAAPVIVQMPPVAEVGTPAFWERRHLNHLRLRIRR
jgi:hypothetical protein